MVEVTIADGEVVLWPKRVALVGYPVFKHFEAQNIQCYMQILPILLLCKWMMLPLLLFINFQFSTFLAARTLASSMGLSSSPSRTFHLLWDVKTHQSTTCRGHLLSGILTWLIRLSPWITSLPIQCQCCLKIKNTIVIHSSASWIPAVTVIAQGRWEASASVKFQRNRAFTQHVSRMSLDKVSWDSEQLCTHFFVA